MGTDKTDLFLKDLIFEKGAVKYPPHTKRRIELKKETFQMRISKDTRADLDRVAKHYNLSASATVDMLIAKETRLIDKHRKEDERGGEK